MSTGDFLEVLSQRILVGIILVGRLGVSCLRVQGLVSRQAHVEGFTDQELRVRTESPPTASNAFESIIYSISKSCV